MLMFTIEGSSCNNNRRLTGDMQPAQCLRGTWREYTVFSVRIQLIQNSRSTYTDFAVISNVANLIFSLRKLTVRFDMPKARRKSSRALAKAKVDRES